MNPAKTPIRDSGQIGDWRYWGRYFGYPECCIDAFEEDAMRHALGFPMRAERLHHPRYGYIVCDACAADPVRGKLLGEEARARREAPVVDEAGGWDLDKLDLAWH